MLSVKGVFENGVARPVDPVKGYEGQVVIITFLEEEATGLSTSEADEGWNSLIELVEGCIVETGITDLAHHHDYYLYGRPKMDLIDE
jgi:hypothetical protein